MGWTAPRRHQVCQDGVVTNPSEGSRPWASLSRILNCHAGRPRSGEERVSGSRGRREGRGRGARALRRGGVAARSSASCRLAWWRWRPARRRITGAARSKALGHEVKLIPAAHVKPYVRRNKNDAADAAAICEAAMRPGQRFVAVRSDREPGRADAPSRARTALGQRTALLNALRGHLAEIGIVAPQGAQHAYRLKRLLPTAPTRTARSWFPNAFAGRWRRSARRSTRSTRRSQRSTSEIAAAVKADEKARRLMTIPGIGPMIASAILATVRDVERFRQRARVRRLSRPDAAPAFERRQGAARAASPRWATDTCASCSWWAPARCSATRKGHNDALRRWAKAMLERKPASNTGSS